MWLTVFSGKVFITAIFSITSVRGQPCVLRLHDKLLNKRSKNNEKEEGQL